MADVADVAAIAAPAFTALAGGYFGARWKARSEADAELRALLDDAIAVLQRLTDKLAAARSHFAADVLDTTDANRRALEALDAERAQAEQISDRLMGRTEPGAPVYEHYVCALQGAEAARDVMVLAARLPVSHDPHYNMATEFDKVEAGRLRFSEERQLFRVAVQARIAPRRFSLRRRRAQPPATP